MKKIIVFILVFVFSFAYALDYKKLIIGKWNVYQIEENNKYVAQMIFDNNTALLVESSGTEEHEYYLKNKEICLKKDKEYKCTKLVWASENEFYMPHDQLKFTRVNNESEN